MSTFAAALLWWSQSRQLAEDRSPSLMVERVEPCLGRPGAFIITLIFRNKTADYWQVERVSVRKPRSAKLIRLDDVPHEGKDWAPEPRKFADVEPSSLSSILHIGTTIAPAGTQSARISGYPPSHVETLVVLTASSRSSIKLSMRASFLSQEANQRRVTIALKRTIKLQHMTMKD